MRWAVRIVGALVLAVLGVLAGQVIRGHPQASVPTTTTVPTIPRLLVTGCEDTATFAAGVHQTLTEGITYDQAGTELAQDAQGPAYRQIATMATVQGHAGIARAAQQLVATVGRAEVDGDVQAVWADLNVVRYQCQLLHLATTPFVPPSS